METNKTTPNTSKQDIAADPFLAEMQSQLTRQSGSISSASTNIEKAISESISNLQKSNASTTKATTSAFDRQIDQTRKSGSFAFTGAQEEQRGFAQNVGILRKINEDTNTNLKDLEQRKQEVILQGDAATASKIADLQLKALEFKQQSEQQVFSNLLSMSNFGLSLKQEERQSRAQDFTEKNAISQIALEFGIPFSENDTIDSIITKAAPFASEDRQLKLQQIRSDIQRSQAETSKALKGDITSRPYDDLTNRILAEKLGTGELTMDNFLKMTNDQQREIMKTKEAVRQEQKNELVNLSKEYKNSNSFLEALKNSNYNVDDVLSVAKTIKPTNVNTGFKRTFNDTIDSITRFLDPEMQANIDKKRQAQKAREEWLKSTKQK